MFIDPLRRAVAITRRDMLARSSVGFGLTALAGLLADEGRASAATNRTRPPRARNVIFCFMSGGVSHVDSFDPKPRLMQDHGKSMPVPVRPTMFNANGNIMASPWEFKNYGQSGLPVSELFPHMGACADELAVIRSSTCRTKPPRPGDSTAWIPRSRRQPPMASSVSWPGDWSNGACVLWNSPVCLVRPS